MADKKDLDTLALRENILKTDPFGGDLKPNTAVDEMQVDSLTGLLNRGLWEAEMQQQYHLAQREKESFAIVMMDIDGFKSKNDQLGHDWGDKILEKLGKELTARLRKSDIKGRYGGDEVIAMLVNFRLNEAGLKEKEKELSDMLSEMGVRISVGMVKWDGVETLEEVIKRADGRMYKNKPNNGK